MQEIHKNKNKFYAFFLPQFHECEYNNMWWGKGFTEWDNVKSATPQYKGHNQPIVPSEGYFDLADKNVLLQQYQQAKQYGIDGFVFYNYWYEGKRPLRKPIDIILENPDLEFNFSLCWANHSWTRSWKNRMGSLDTLIEQTYENNTIEREKYFDFLLKVFSDKRYIKVDNKPIFQIYIPQNIPNLLNFVEELRQYCRNNKGIEIHISALITSWKKDLEYLDCFDSATLFQPTLSLFSPIDIFGKASSTLFKEFNFNAFVRDLPLSIKKYLYIIQDSFFNKLQFFDYDAVWKKLIEQYKVSVNSKIKVFPSAFVNFDNTPRYKQRAKIIKGFSAEKFGKYVEQLNNLEPEIVFINAWNEWGEGMFLQPDTIYGNSKLEAIKNIKWPKR